MHAAGWNVIVVCPRRHGRRSAREIEDVRKSTGSTRSRAGGALGYLREYRAAFAPNPTDRPRFARTRHVDVVQAATRRTSSSSRHEGAATRRRNDLRPPRPEPGALRGEVRSPWRGLPRATRRPSVSASALSDVVISTNDSFRQVAVERGRRDPADVFVVRNGPDPSIFRPGPGDPALRKAGQYLIGYAGRMGSQDGMLEAIETLGILRRRRSDWHAVFAGDGEALPRARSLAASLAEVVVTVTGFVTDRERIVELLELRRLPLTGAAQRAQRALDLDQGRRVHGRGSAGRGIRPPRDPRDGGRFG